MIIMGSDGDDEAKVVGMETVLCRRYRLARKSLYPAIRHANFHWTYADPERFWAPACYAAFSGNLVNHHLGHDSLRDLLQDFTAESESRHRSWMAIQAEEMRAGGHDRQSRDYVAIGLRYVCAVADDYTFPAPDILERLTPDQFRQLNDYLAYVSEHALIPAGKFARLACKRQLDDLGKLARG